jgi:hypothetical protein
MQLDSIKRFVRPTRFGQRTTVTVGAFLVILASSAWAAPGTIQGSIFTCSVNGKTFSGDRPPQECANSEMRELNRDGSVRRVIARPLTQEELRARALEAKKRLEEEDKQLAQRRRDKSLLEAYASDEEIEAARAKSLESATQAMARAKARIDNLNAERKKLDDEAEFYKKRVLPDQISRKSARRRRSITTRS